MNWRTETTGRDAGWAEHSRRILVSSLHLDFKETRQTVREDSTTGKVTLRMRRPTFYLDEFGANLTYEAGMPELNLKWIDYPETFATFMNFSQPDHIEVTRLRLVEKEN